MEKTKDMLLPKIRLDRTIIYNTAKVCPFCKKSNEIVREEYVIEDLIYIVYGPGDNDYGRIVNPPPDIPAPNESTTKLSCGNCKEPLPLDVLEAANVVSDSKFKAYEEYLQRIRHGLI